ncbi:MAG: ABC transporter substrate-binding protein [Janthinobacterium lividum]
MSERHGPTRRTLLRTALAAPAALVLPTHARAADALPTLRLGTVQFGTVQWLAVTIRALALDTAHGFALDTVLLANTEASRVALMAGSADVALSDWLFVARQRQEGTPLSFAPFSASAGGVMVPQDSPVRALADLKGRRLGVAGGANDRSWLLVQAAARAQGLDLARDAPPAYGAPPLLGAKLQQGELDALLTFWNFEARLESQGFREAVSVADCARALGLPADLDLLGFVFLGDWASAHRPVLDGFLAAAAEAESRLAADPALWTPLRPLMQLPPGAPGEAMFAALRRRFLAGFVHPNAATQRATATRVLAILQDGGEAASLRSIPEGVFWPEAA